MLKAPTERANGDALTQEEIIRYDLAYDMPTDGLDEFWQWSVDATVNCVTFSPTTPEEVCFVGTATATDNTGSALELTSGLSNVVCRLPVEIEQPSIPKPPALYFL